MASKSLRFRTPSSFLQNLPSSHAERCRKYNLSQSLGRTLDRVNVLGDNETYGHTGCVNALSWARDGELLISGGDDTSVRMWRMDPDPADTSQDYPFSCCAVIHTGHRANIFNAQMLPHSSRIATVAGDRQVRVFEVGEAHSASPTGRETEYSSSQSCIHTLRCHNNRVKRIVLEDSPDRFLSVGEDGTVRQHDLRTPHDCRNRACPPPLVKIGHELSTLSLSPLTPYHFVVAGESPYGYLFDRRQVGRVLQEEWGMASQASEDLTTCVRRFGRVGKTSSGQSWRRRDHITGARMSNGNGHEVLLSYSGDGIYLYSTRDDPDIKDSVASEASPLLSPNIKRRKLEDVKDDDCAFDAMDEDIDEYEAMSFDPGEVTDEDGDENEDGDDDEDDDDEIHDIFRVDEPDYHPHVPVILPRKRYLGARNVATIKDVNFLGPSNEFVTSGSDEGNFFVWHKSTGALHGIYEGDSSVVNVIEGHPYLPLVAVSGIDTTIKLFAPSAGASQFSRLDNATRIMETNARQSRTRRIGYDFAALLSEARAAMTAEEFQAGRLPECTSQ